MAVLTDEQMAQQDTPLGSAAWISAEEYEVRDELHNRATSFASSIKWDVLELCATKLRQGISCHVGENYSVGHFNMVRKLTFQDGVSWVARFRLPELKAVFGERETLDVERCMKAEIATMALLKTRTSIPVPEVFQYDVSANNELGAPYILMSYINGNAASGLRVEKECKVGKFGDPEQDLKFRKQMARIQVELSSITFDKIGAIYQDGETFVVGPEIETGEGPRSVEIEYYAAMASHAFQVAKSDAPPEFKTKKSFDLPLMFEKLMPLCKQWPEEHQFQLANRDFGAHNLLVDNEFNIIGLIDFDRVMTAPLAVVAQFPQLTGLERQIPGYVESRPALSSGSKGLSHNYESTRTWLR
ncbi:hypothetical protein BKA65DRAFT_513916 [Rhexocercosporidium sp. MPI-PUGE-AT-0058]|nr:hypothetical protein BKA65DRAFT_513916 [Rhexocercosporidium sp. MPI-PUGE-AT-0058]